jgi:hypothetical protein
VGGWGKEVVTETHFLGAGLAGVALGDVPLLKLVLPFAGVEEQDERGGAGRGREDEEDDGGELRSAGGRERSSPSCYSTVGIARVR